MNRAKRQTILGQADGKASKYKKNQQQTEHRCAVFNFAELHGTYRLDITLTLQGRMST
jgi:hypothetical protein